MSFEPGQLLDGSYTVVGVLGRGGMATVYDARTAEGQPVAIKVLQAGNGDLAELRRRFLNELVLATRVQHPHIVKVHDYGVTRDDRLYIVMERLSGWTLAEELRKVGAESTDRLMRRVVEALDGVAEAHASGIVHADIKPSNLFLREPRSRDEALMVLDFGVAHRTRDQGERGGTPQYAPPELLRGAPSTPASDVYQLGLVLAELISGEPVVRSRNLKALREVFARGPLPLPDAVRASAFHDLIRASIDPEASQRPSDAAVFRDELVVAYARHRLGGRGPTTLAPLDERLTVRYDGVDDSSDLEGSLAPVAPEPDRPGTSPPPAPPPALAPTERAWMSFAIGVLLVATTAATATAVSVVVMALLWMGFQ